MAQNIPQNQLDALPLIGVTDVVAADSTIVIGGAGIVRYWGPSSTGINGLLAGLGDNGLQAGIFSNFLDFTGMSQFVLVLNCRFAAAGAFTPANGLAVYLDARVHGEAAYAINDPVYNATASMVFVAGMTGAYNPVAAAGFPFFRKAMRTWCNQSVPTSGDGEAVCTFTGDQRLLIRATTGSADLTLFGHVYAQGP